LIALEKKIDELEKQLQDPNYLEELAKKISLLLKPITPPSPPTGGDTKMYEA